MDNLFLPTIFVIFLSSLSSVLVINYYAKPSTITRKLAVITTGLYLLSAIAFILQVKTSWMLDFLHQIDLVSKPVLWQRLLEDFILAHKLTIDTTENYWITSQLLLFTLSFVVFVNMYSTSMELQFYQILGYMALGLTGSYGGVLALFLVHFYYASSRSPLMAKLTTAQLFTQVVSTFLGCAAVLYLYDASVLQVRTTLLPLVVTAFLLPFVPILFQGQERRSGMRTSLLYFLIFLGIFMALHHVYMTLMVALEWLMFRALLMVAFDYPYQFSISVDLICCIVITSIYVLLELNELKLEFKHPYYYTVIYKLLVPFFGIIATTFVISPGAMLLFVLAYREKAASPSRNNRDFTSGGENQ